MGIEIFKKHLREKRAIKINTGINNIDIENVKKIAAAAQNAKASAIDICANKDIYKAARQSTRLPIFVSSLHPFEILEAVKWGADAVEIGNYSQLYKKGLSFDENEVYEITLETLGLINKYDVYTSVTIPGCIELSKQTQLARKLEILGIDLIQTEGLTRIDNNIRKQNAKFIDDVEENIKNTFELNNATLIPIVSSGGFDQNSTSLAFNSGASGVSIDYNNKTDSEAIISAQIMRIVNSISYRNSFNKELVKTSRELGLIR